MFFLLGLIVLGAMSGAALTSTVYLVERTLHGKPIDPRTLGAVALTGAIIGGVVVPLSIYVPVSVAPAVEVATQAGIGAGGVSTIIGAGLAGGKMDDLLAPEPESSNLPDLSRLEEGPGFEWHPPRVEEEGPGFELPTLTPGLLSKVSK